MRHFSKTKNFQKVGNNSKGKPSGGGYSTAKELKMEFVLEPAKNQKFDIGRTINLSKCDCEKCDFMHCPKNNYALKMVQKKYTVQDFFDENKTAIMKKGRLWNFFDYETLADFIDACVSGFPKGTYWNMDNDCAIELVTQNRSKHGEDFLARAEVSLSDDLTIVYYTGCSEGQEKLAKKIKTLLSQLNDLFEAEKLKDSNVGWLDRTGRLYKCRRYGHIELAEKLGENESSLENQGWCKIFSESTYYCCSHPSAEQLNWLIANGYENND